MLSTAYATPLHLELRPSHLLAGMLLLVHCGALMLLLLLPFDVWLRLLMLLPVIYSGIRTIPRVLLRSPYAMAKLVWEVDDEWTLDMVNGESSKARLLRTTFVHPMMVVLNFDLKYPKRRNSVVLLPDSIDRATFRRLRVRLNLN